MRSRAFCIDTNVSPAYSCSISNIFIKNSKEDCHEKNVSWYCTGSLLPDASAYAQAQSGAPSESMLVSGFKQALSIGTEKAVQTVSKPDGYFGNQAIKILLPDSMQKVADTLGKARHAKAG